jgi:hypothetical protein
VTDLVWVAALTSVRTATLSATGARAIKKLHRHCHCLRSVHLRACSTALLEVSDHNDEDDARNEDRYAHRGKR